MATSPGSIGSAGTALLALYARPYAINASRWLASTRRAKQLLAHARAVRPGGSGILRKEDYAYRRAGTCTLFVAVEPRGGQRQVRLTARRTKEDCVGLVRHRVNAVYPTAGKVHRVLDHLNTHCQTTFEQVMGPRSATAFLRRVQFHYTPKHASWLNRAAVEIGILDRQCSGGRIASAARMTAQVATWQQRRNDDASNGASRGAMRIESWVAIMLRN